RFFGAWNGAILAGMAYLATVALGMLILPPVNEVPADFSATTLWRFRVASLGIELVLWTTLGLVFGAFADRLLTVAARPGVRISRRPTI
ncbi:MAG TPA: CbtA family protein, partial [Stellaceae bacterium]|nr:CbtA family protein [Stellaceae bacterium]